MNTCKDCGAKMVPLFLGTACSAECDLKQVAAYAHPTGKTRGDIGWANAMIASGIAIECTSCTCADQWCLSRAYQLDPSKPNTVHVREAPQIWTPFEAVEVFDKDQILKEDIGSDHVFGVTKGKY